MERVGLGPYVNRMPEPDVNLVTLVTVRPWLDAAGRQSADSGSAAGGGSHPLVFVPGKKR